MSKTQKVVHISAGHADLDPEFTISVGNVPFRFMMSPSGRSINPRKGVMNVLIVAMAALGERE
jgi:hypothetical protein